MITKLANAPQDCISRVRFAPFANSSYLLTSSWDSHVRLYDVSSGQLLGIHKQPLPLLDCTFAQDPTKGLFVGLQKKLVLFDFRAQQELAIGFHDQAIRCVEFHHQSQQVFTGSWDKTLKAWDQRQPTKPVAAVDLGSKAFAMDTSAQKVIFGCADRRIHIFDVRQLGVVLEKRESMLRHQIRAVKVSLDGQKFAASSVEGRVAIESLTIGGSPDTNYAFKCHRVREADGPEVVHPVNALAFHPVHGTLGTGGSDGGVCVWDTNAKKRLWRLNPFDTSVSSLSFSEDGKHLAIAVSYTFDSGEKIPPPAAEVVIRQITDSEVQPKSQPP